MTAPRGTTPGARELEAKGASPSLAPGVRVALLVQQRVVELSPDDPEIAHILVALTDGSPPARASDACIRHLYGRFAEFYEHNMLEELEYRGPAILEAVLAEACPSPRGDLRVLELGCGTGLVGESLRSRARRLVGVDLSSEMIALASAGDVYDELHVAEITAWLAEGESSFDLIVAVDVFIYFGDLTDVLCGAGARLAPGGHLAFTVETGTDSGWRLTDSGRYEHGVEHLRAAAARADLAVVKLEEAVLRREYGEPTRALVAVLRAR